jgi:hypothetical protein
LNLIEGVWQYIKQKLSGVLYDNLDEIKEKVRSCLEKFSSETIASIAGWEYILSALATLSMILGKWYNLNFMALYVPAWLLLTLFFYDLILTSVARYTLLFYPPNFLFSGQIAYTTLRLVALGCALTIYCALCFGIIQMNIPWFSSGFWLYTSLYFCCLTSF